MGTNAHILPAVDMMVMRKGPTLTQQQQQDLNAEITKQEIDEALKGIGSDKAPGIDGYNTEFFKKAWPVIKEEVYAAVKEFFSYRGDVSIIASRLQKIMPCIISEAQAGFIPGRKIADNIILAHELVKAYSRKHISPRCMVKVDMMKAYDSVEWVYLDQLSELLKGLKQAKEYRFYPRCGNIDITHLSFADDLLMFARGDSKSVSTLHACFMQFSTASGLLANPNKSVIYFGGVAQDVRLEILQNTGYSLGELPFKYLGIPLDTKKLTALQWQPLIDKIVARISSWTARKLSYAGRVQLVQTVIFGIQSYWSQIFILPAKMMELIESYCRSYIWPGSNTITKRALRAWEKMCFPKSAGGYNLLNIRVWNRAAITNVYWDLAQKKDKVWIKWIHTYYIKGFAKTVWGRHLQWLQIHDASIQSCTKMMAWVITQAKRKSCKAKVMKMIDAEYIHGIWKERNSRIFEEKTRTAILELKE
ncbi:PREDICTED: uncharacterized protein LOC109216980 [Nicotiana attenuata]|uniref:uncharacterized protein LOC109216980 n=1 Tax=Nicotiana attenuata TaxID=49451 RepID=UPI000905A06C|nr:PREDICTED: uncharacterized protein LOC109216980 [Nicotiana attenuata]